MGTFLRLSVIAILTILGVSIAAGQEVRPSTAPGGATAKLASAPRNQIYNDIFDVWSRGDQAKAESLLEDALQADPRNIRLAFFRIACERSRFNVAGTVPMFRALSNASPNTIEGACAAIMATIDAGKDVDNQFAALQRLVEASAEDPLVLWMAAVECRSLNKNEIGVKYYERLSALVNPGPVLLHQTYANLLDQLKRYDDALVHRNLAVKLEPAPWSYQGLGNTLNSMRRYKEAGDAYSKALEMSPGNPTYLWNWASALHEAGKYEESIEKARKALESDPRMTAAWNVWGLNLGRLDRWDEAIEKYQKGMEADPTDHYCYRNAVLLLRGLGREKEANEIMDKWKARNGTTLNLK